MPESAQVGIPVFPYNEDRHSNILILFSFSKNSFIRAPIAMVFAKYHKKNALYALVFVRQIVCVEGV
jgi:hypothetical protein